MRLRLEQIIDGEEEVHIRYQRMTATIQSICDLVTDGQEKILVRNDEGSRYLLLDEGLYFESIDGQSFAYTEQAVYRLSAPLKSLVTAYDHRGFFRCAKSMVLNIYRIESFNSQSFGRIEATLDNGEKIIISRKYASELRRVLQEGVQDEE